MMPPSQLLKKFAPYPHQHELAVALREIGRIDRNPVHNDWLLDTDMRRHVQIVQITTPCQMAFFD